MVQDRNTKGEESQARREWIRGKGSGTPARKEKKRIAIFVARSSGKLRLEMGGRDGARGGGGADGQTAERRG